MTKTYNVENIGKVKRTKLIQQAVRKHGYTTSLDKFIGSIKNKISSEVFDIFLKGFEKHRMASIGQSGVEPLSMISYTIIKLSAKKCGFYISRLRMGDSSGWGKDPELRIIIENEDEYKILWLQNFTSAFERAVTVEKVEKTIVRSERSLAFDEKMSGLVHDVLSERQPSNWGDEDWRVMMELEKESMKVGSTRMTCSRCGNYDVNNMIVHFVYLDSFNEVSGDATTLPKFLCEMKYENRKTGSIDKHNLSAIRVLKITCDACINMDMPEGELPKDYQASMEIKPTRYGV